MKESTPEIHKKEAKKSFSFALITISTSRYEKYGDSTLPEEAEDLSGKAMKDLLKRLVIKLLSTGWFPTKKPQLQMQFLPPWTVPQIL